MTEVETQGRKISTVLNMMIGEIRTETLTWRKELEETNIKLEQEINMT